MDWGYYQPRRGRTVPRGARARTMETLAMRNARPTARPHRTLTTIALLALTLLFAACAGDSGGGDDTTSGMVALSMVAKADHDVCSD